MCSFVFIRCPKRELFRNIFSFYYLCRCTAPKRTNKTTRPSPPTHNPADEVIKQATRQAKAHSDPSRLLQRTRHHLLTTPNLEYHKQGHRYQQTLTKGLGLAQAHLEPKHWPSPQEGQT